MYIIEKTKFLFYSVLSLAGAALTQRLPHNKILFLSEWVPLDDLVAVPANRLTPEKVLEAASCESSALKTVKSTTKAESMKVVSLSSDAPL